MLVALAAVIFAVSTVGCAHRLRYAKRAWEYAAFTPFIVSAWVALLSVRAPTAKSMTLSFLLLDMSIMLLASLGVFRMLGAFEENPWATGDEDDDGGGGGGGGGPEPIGPFLPRAPGDPRDLHPAHRPPAPGSPRRPRGIRPAHRTPRKVKVTE